MMPNATFAKTTPAVKGFGFRGTTPADAAEQRVHVLEAELRRHRG